MLFFDNSDDNDDENDDDNDDDTAARPRLLPCHWAVPVTDSGLGGNQWEKDYEWWLGKNIAIMIMISLMIVNISIMIWWKYIQEFLEKMRL